MGERERSAEAVAFGRVLKELREERRLSQETLAAESGLHRTYVSLLERGENGPSLAVLLRLGAVLGVDASELVRRVEARLAGRGGDVVS